MAGTIKHSWNGTILTIESDSGISSCDLKGDKGDTGIRGPQGATGEKGGAVDSVNGKIGEVVLTNEDVGALPDTYEAPVSSVNGKRGAVELTYEDIGAMPDTYTAPVTSVNGNTGAVNLTYTDVGAMPNSYVAPVTSVNTKTGAVNLTYSDVGAAAENHTHSYNDLTDLPTIGGGGGDADTLDGKHASDFALANHTHSLTDNTITDILPVIKGGTGGNDASTACANINALKITPYSENAGYVAGYNDTSLWLCYTVGGEVKCDIALRTDGRFTVNNQNIILNAYPVGSIYMSVNNVSPATLFGGTWEQIQDTFLLAAGTKHSAGSTGGAESYSLSVSHKHTSPLGHNTDAVGGVAINGTISSGKGKAYKTAKVDYSGNSLSSNITAYYTGDATVSDTIQTMPPYLAVYMWKRTA